MEIGAIPSEKYAQELDKLDSLKELCQRLYIHDNKIYVNGNSLELLSGDSDKSINRVPSEWKNPGIEDRFEAKYPWFYLAEKIGADLPVGLAV